MGSGNGTAFDVIWLYASASDLLTDLLWPSTNCHLDSQSRISVAIFSFRAPWFYGMFTVLYDLFQMKMQYILFTRNQAYARKLT